MPHLNPGSQGVLQDGIPQRGRSLLLLFLPASPPHTISLSPLPCPYKPSLSLSLLPPPSASPEPQSGSACGDEQAASSGCWEEGGGWCAGLADRSPSGSALTPCSSQLRRLTQVLLAWQEAHSSFQGSMCFAIVLTPSHLPVSRVAPGLRPLPAPLPQPRDPGQIGPQTLTRGLYLCRSETGFAFYCNSVSSCCSQHCARHGCIEGKGQVWAASAGKGVWVLRRDGI